MTEDFLTFEEHLMSKPALAQARQWDRHDGTLAGGERALADVVYTLLEQTPRLNAATLTDLAEVLTIHAQEVQAAEDAAWKHLKALGLNLDDQPE